MLKNVLVAKCLIISNVETNIQGKLRWIKIYDKWTLLQEKGIHIARRNWLADIPATKVTFEKIVYKIYTLFLLSKSCNALSNNFFVIFTVNLIDGWY